jgi:hypothetical protein
MIGEPPGPSPRWHLRLELHGAFDHKKTCVEQTAEISTCGTEQDTAGHGRLAC